MSDEFDLIDPEGAHEFLASFDAQTRQQGEAYFREGRVGALRCQEPGADFSTEVRGSQTYEVDLYVDDLEGWFGACSCPRGVDCKHVYAAFKALLAEYNVAQVQALSAGAGRTKVSVVSAKPPVPPPTLSTPAFVAKIESALKRRLRKGEKAFLATLEMLYQRCRGSRAITRWDFAELGFTLPGYGWEPLHPWPAFPEDLATFWLYLANTVAEHQLALPDFLAPVTDLNRIQEELRQWRRKAEVDRWKHVLASPNWSLSPVTTMAEPMDLRVRVGPKAASFECRRPGQEGFRAIAAKQSRQFSEDCQSGRITLTSQADYLWQTYQYRLFYGRSLEIPYTDREGLEILNRVFRQPLLAEHVVTEEGAPFLRATAPLRWSIASPADLEGDYALRLVQADGAPSPPLLFVLRGAPTLYVTRDTIFPGPPHDAHVLDSARENLVPAAALETVAGVEFLEALQVGLPPRLQERVERVPVQVSLHCELRPPTVNGQPEYCVVRVLARSADGRVHQTWDGHAWFNTRPEPPPRAAGGPDGRLLLYDRSVLGEVLQLLEPLELRADGTPGGLVVRVTKRFPETFTEWLRQVPPAIQVHLAGELASLAQGAVSGRVRLEVTEAEIDWFDLKVVLDVSDTELTQEELRLLLNARGQYVRLGQKGWRRLQFDLTEEEDERLARLGLNPHELTAEPQRLHALQLADDAARKFLPAEQADRIQRRAGEIKARVTPPLPAGLTAELRPYQVEGYHFLAYLAANRFGGILADDMGLGKTLQALAWLLWLRGTPENASRPSLVVCPKSVTDNWHAEAARFASALRVKVWPASELEQLVGRLAEADLHVINYSQLRILGESLVSVPWLGLILDEGQYIKNPNSQTAQVARALHATHRLVLSGTPIENRLMDLWSLMAFTMPGALGSRYSFAKVFDVKNDPLARRRLSARVRPFLLRRTKVQVAKDLPDKIEEDLFCEIEGEQKSLYRAELKFAQQLLLRIKTQKQLAKEQFHFLASLLRLRQICCHPKLVKPDSKAESAKVNALVEQLEPLMEEGEKVLVFSQFVSMLDLLRPVLEERGWPLYYLVGDTEHRGDLVQRFQAAEGAAVFLISLRAGGFGLNLTAANYVVLFDPWWNPAVETQAIDRTHRIGQLNKVIAYRLLIKDSIEEKIRLLQRQKSQLAEDVLGEEKFSQSLTLEDLQFLFAD